MLAYLVNQYPKASHSFIRREIQELERQGWQVQRIALRRCNEPLPDPADRAERERTTYVLGDVLPTLLSLVTLVMLPLRLTLATLLRHPRRFLRASALALRTGWRAQRPLRYHLAYLVEACVVARLLRTSGAQHLHAHFGTNAAQVAMLAAVLASVSYSFTVHGPEEFDHADRLHLREKIQRAAFVVAISAFGRSQLFRCLPCADWGKVQVVRCGLPPDYGSGATALPRSPRLICVGRLCEQKGQLLLLQAVVRLRATGIALQLVLAGDGDLRTELEQFNLRDTVTITGWLSSEQVRQEILAARALVLPSFAEGLPVALMEAMALGRPVLSTYVAGIPELVAPGRNGWLIPAGDLDALTRALTELLATPLPELARLGANAGRDVLQHHDLEREVAKLGAHFRTLAAPTSAACMGSST